MTERQAGQEVESPTETEAQAAANARAQELFDSMPPDEFKTAMAVLGYAPVADTVAIILGDKGVHDYRSLAEMVQGKYQGDIPEMDQRPEGKAW